MPGEPFEVIAESLPGGDPIAVRIGGSCFALRRREAAAVMVKRGLMNAAADLVAGATCRGAGAAHRPGRRAQLRQDRAVQPPDRQPPEGGQLRGRDGGAQGRRERTTRPPAATTACSTCPAAIALRPPRWMKPSRAMRCWAAWRGEHAAGPHRQCGGCHEPPARPAPVAGAAAPRPADDRGAEHERHRAGPRHERGSARALRRSWVAPWWRRWRWHRAASGSCWRRARQGRRAAEAHRRADWSPLRREEIEATQREVRRILNDIGYREPLRAARWRARIRW